MGLFSFLTKSNNLYYPGCMSYHKFKEQYELYEKIFDKLSINYKIINKNVCCGLLAYELGYEANSRKLARKNFEIFKEEKINSIITTCPNCYKMFKDDYSRFLPDWNINVIDIWREILNKLENRPGLIKRKVNENITIIDSCYLGRYSGIYSELRLILSMLGYNTIELVDNRENSFCTGSCGGLPITNPELANKCAKEKIMQIKREGIKKIIVFSLQDYKLLKDNLEDSDIMILEFSEVLAHALDIKELSIENSGINKNIAKEEIV